MDFSRFSLNFTEFDRFFQKLSESEGADFLISTGFLNTAPALLVGWMSPPFAKQRHLSSVYGAKTVTSNPVPRHRMMNSLELVYIWLAIQKWITEFVFQKLSIYCICLALCAMHNTKDANTWLAEPASSTTVNQSSNEHADDDAAASNREERKGLWCQRPVPVNICTNATSKLLPPARAKCWFFIFYLKNI
jgi:hypothetical protein